MLQVIYIPGLGDRRITLQRVAVKLWRIWGVAPHVFHMQWGDTRPYDVKRKELLAQIDTLASKGPVAVVGASAGAGAAINAYAARNALTAVVTIAGKINNPQTISAAYKQRSTSFWSSAQQVPESLATLTPVQRSRMLSIRARFDEIVPAQDSIVPGAINKVAWTAGHAITIAWQLVFGARSFLRFIKQQNEQ
jgi:dienelactone hydrolase